MTERYGGIGIAMVGALGGTQPCRSACSFTHEDNPGYTIEQRKPSIVANYLAHVEKSVGSAKLVTGPVAAAQGHIREAITGPAVLALFLGGEKTGTRLLRATENPWVVGNTVRTVTSAIR